MEELKKLSYKKTNYSIRMINNYQKLIANLVYYDNYFSITLSERVGKLEQYAEKLYKKALNFEIVNKNNDRLGMISFYANDFINNVAFLTLIVVDKNNSNCGIGSILIDFFEEYCKDKGMKEIKLEVLKNNENALKFYKKHNYFIVEENEKTYYMAKKI